MRSINTLFFIFRRFPGQYHNGLECVSNVLANSDYQWKRGHLVFDKRMKQHYLDFKGGKYSKYELTIEGAKNKWYSNDMFFGSSNPPKSACGFDKPITSIPDNISDEWFYWIDTVIRAAKKVDLKKYKKYWKSYYSIKSWTKEAKKSHIGWAMHAIEQWINIIPEVEARLNEIQEKRGKEQYQKKQFEMWDKIHKFMFDR